MEAEDAGQQVVEVVRDAAGERAERLHLLRLEQLELQLAAVGLGLVLRGDVLERAVDARGAAFLQLGAAEDADPHVPALDGDEREFAVEHVDAAVGVALLDGLEVAGREQPADVVERRLVTLRRLVDAVHLARPGDDLGVEIDLPAADAGEAAHLVGELVGAAQPVLEVLAGGDVGVRADHAQRPAVGGALHDLAAVEDPAPRPGLGPHAVFRRIARADLGQVFVLGLLRGGHVVGVNQLPPAFERGVNFARLVAQHARPLLVVVDLARREIPVPDGLIGTFQRELPARDGLGGARCTGGARRDGSWGARVGGHCGGGAAREWREGIRGGSAGQGPRQPGQAREP